MVQKILAHVNISLVNMLDKFLPYILLVNNKQFYVNSAVFRRQLRILPKEWVQEWQNLY